MLACLSTPRQTVVRWGISALTVSLLAASAGTALAAPDGAGRPAVVTVTDPAGIGAVGNGRLSLAEAIRLANGSLAVTELDAGERRNVKGHPGRGRGDLVRTAIPQIMLPAGSTPTVPSIGHEDVASLLPTLVGNDGDVFDGGGTVLANGEDGGPISGLAMRITSSGFTLRGWTLRRFYNAVDVKAPNSSGLADVVLTGNRLEDGGGIFVDAVAADGSLVTVRRINISNNTILGAPEFGRKHPAPIFTLPILIIAHADYDPDFDPTATGPSRVEDVMIARNTVRGYGTGGSISVTSSTTPAPSTDAHMARISVLGNDVEIPDGGVDPGFMIWGAANLQGQASNITMKDVVVSGNRFAGGTLPFYAAVTEHVFGAAETNDVHWDGLRFTDNRLESLGECRIGLMITSAFQELGGGLVRNSNLRNLEIARNTVTGCPTGMLVTPAVFLAGAGVSTQTTITGARITDNTIVGAVDGILAAGGVVTISPLTPVGTPGAAATGNRFADLRVTGNRISATRHGVRLHGGFVEAAGGNLVVANTLSRALASGNTVTGPSTCTASADFMDTSGGVAADNVLDHVTCGS